MSTVRKDIKLMNSDLKILQFAADGFRYCDIATKLGYKTEQSVKNRAGKVIQHLGADSLAHAVAIAMRRKLIT